jgi:hypothetical protein
VSLEFTLFWVSKPNTATQLASTAHCMNTSAFPNIDTVITVEFKVSSPKQLCIKAQCHGAKSTCKSKNLDFIDESAAANVLEAESTMHGRLFLSE